MATASTGQQDLSSLIMRATNPLNEEDDPNLVQAVCQDVGNDAGKIQVAVRLIVHKMQSPHPREALQALLVLQACINNCGPNFHSEIGKFRFLNEMIKLVSPKYLGNQTPTDVKKRVVELLYTWTRDLKNEPKVAEAYEMLKKQGVVKEDPIYLGVNIQPSTKSQQPAAFEDEKKSRLLQRLLQSKRPEDISKANALIKHMVKEDERRLERSSRRIVEVETAFNNVKVLDEMLTQYKESDSASQADLDLMEELFSSCQTLRANIYRIVSEMDDKEDGMGELLKASDELSRVMGRYKLETEGKAESSSSQSTAEPDSEKKVEQDSLLDLSTEFQPIKSESQTLDELEELDKLAINNVFSSQPIADKEKVANSTRKESILDELGEVFSNGSALLGQNDYSKTPELGSSNLLIAQELMPQPLSPFKNNQPLEPEKSITDKESPKIINDLDLLGTSLLRESLPSHVAPMGSQFKVQEKVSLNKLKEKSRMVETSTKNPPPYSLEESASINKNSTLPTPLLSADDFDIELLGDLLSTNDNNSTQSSKEISKDIPQSTTSSRASSAASDSKIISCDTSPFSSLVNTKNETDLGSSDKPKSKAKVQLCEVKPLNNIFVALEDIKPGKQSSVSLMESNNVSVVLHFTENKPRSDVSIIVVSVTSRNPQAISNYVLQAVGPKGCKVRLLAPSSTTLSEYSPFLPPPAITQIMLIANPNQLNVSLKVMLSYTIDDDPVTDMGEIDSLPL